MPEAPPTFVVVGHVNQGKSSIVAALAEDPSVPIDAMPGTTVRAGEYAFRAGGEVVFRIVDTPGFQRARHALDWLRQRSHSAADRRSTVAAFVAAHAAGGEFVDEVRLLEPLLQGARIIYVVDPSSRFEPTSEAEMEILRWTGQPGMALLNRTGERDYSDEWRPILQQFFGVVRTFDAHRARFAERLALLRAFREVSSRPEALDRALAIMADEDARRSQQAAAVVADLLVQALGHVERQRLADGGQESVAAALQQRFADAQRRFEQDARRAVQAAYGHGRLEPREGEVSLLDADLLSEESWTAFGLSRAQAMKYGFLGGGAAGLAIDAMTGGLSGWVPTAAGAGIGAITGWFGTTQLAKVWGESSVLAKVLFPDSTGRFLAVGPVTNPRYAWLLLDRALVHARAVRDRSHARRDELDLRRGDDKLGVVAGLADDLRRRLDRALRGLLKAARTGAAPDRGALVDLLVEALRS